MWGSQQMQLLLCFCTMLTTWSGTTFLRIPSPVWFWVRLYHKEICMRFGKQWSEGTAVAYAHLWLICSLPNLVCGGRWASGPSSSHHISSLASPRAGPVACIFLGEASSFFGRSPTLSRSEVATHQCEFQFVYMGPNLFFTNSSLSSFLPTSVVIFPQLVLLKYRDDQPTTRCTGCP